MGGQLDPRNCPPTQLEAHEADEADEADETGAHVLTG